MIPIFYMEEQGQRGCCPFPLHPKSPPTQPPLRCGRSRLTIPNTYSTITMPASLRSDCCSPSLRNAVRLPSGIDVRLHRNTHPPLQGHRITAWGFLDDGLGEGLTHVVTEDIFEDQGITQYYKPVYSERVAVVRKLIERFDVGPFGDALFGGNVKSLQPLLDAYGSEGMRQINILTTANNSKAAIEYIDNHRGR